MFSLIPYACGTSSGNGTRIAKGSSYVKSFNCIPILKLEACKKVSNTMMRLGYNSDDWVLEITRQGSSSAARPHAS